MNLANLGFAGSQGMRVTNRTAGIDLGDQKVIYGISKANLEQQLKYLEFLDAKDEPPQVLEPPDDYAAGNQYHTLPSRPAPGASVKYSAKKKELLAGCDGAGPQDFNLKLNTLTSDED